MLRGTDIVVFRPYIAACWWRLPGQDPLLERQVRGYGLKCRQAVLLRDCEEWCAVDYSRLLPLAYAKAQGVAGARLAGIAA